MNEVFDYELDLLNFEIEELALRREWHLRAPWEQRVCNRCEWHKALRYMNAKLNSLRTERLELLVEREMTQQQ